MHSHNEALKQYAKDILSNTKCPCCTASVLEPWTWHGCDSGLADHECDKPHPVVGCGLWATVLDAQHNLLEQDSL